MFPTPEHETEKVLYAADELTGLTGDRFAYGVWDVRPARSQSTLFST